jgi:hypothetical protein
VRVEAVGDAWYAYSPWSGETLRVNVEMAAVLELLDLGDEAAIAEALAADTGVPAAAIRASLTGIWDQLRDAGLIQRLPARDGNVPTHPG